MEGVGLFVDAKNPVEIAESILSIHNNTDMREDLISRGLELADKYKNYSYFQEMQKIVDSYALFCKTWKDV
jgi:hypothetical protein